MKHVEPNEMLGGNAHSAGRDGTGKESVEGLRPYRGYRVEGKEARVKPASVHYQGDNNRLYWVGVSKKHRQFLGATED